MKKILERPAADLNRPYEKCLRYGPTVLNDAELLAVVIRSGIKGKSAVELAEQILAKNQTEKGLLGLLHMSMADLMEIPGIGEVKAIQLKCIAELSRRISSSSAETGLDFGNPRSVAEYYMESLRHKEQEELVLVMLDTKCHRIGDAVVFTGTVNASLVSTRELFLAAIRNRAVQIILLHNHPSGDPTPSEEDIAVTRKVAEAGKLLDIHLVDHIVIGDRCYVSFRESKLLRFEDF